VEGGAREFDALEVGAQEAAAPAAALAGGRDHLLAHVYAGHARAALDQGERVAAGAAAHVQNLFAAHVAGERERLRQLRVVADGDRLVLAVAASDLVVKFLDRFRFHQQPRPHHTITDLTAKKASHNSSSPDAATRRFASPRSSALKKSRHAVSTSRRTHA